MSGQSVKTRVPYQQEGRADRVFLRGLTGEYSLKEELKRLRSLPRVIKAEEVPWVDGPQVFSKHMLVPEDGLGQTIHIHVEEYAPGARSQMHGHVNEAMFYILDGKGYDIHDGEKLEWEAGDVVIVPNHTVHQHFNADPNKPARAVVIKTKPMFIFMNMIFQKTVKPRPKEDLGYTPRDEPETEG
ncbi:cupin domain-containing protein [Sulfolobus tengchongensis]|uniref:Cupin domain-containing protein n=1 Tax=Sulfolobus tengchongensis TaxID=207809 RepID=A0AAX4L2F5_9CREN